jgi:hypothetical protein
MRPMTRLPPKLAVTAMQTYEIRSPKSTHFRPATCAEVECPRYMKGWRTIVPADSAAAGFIRRDKTRRHTEERQPGGLTCFDFGPGQECFDWCADQDCLVRAGADHHHHAPVGRPEHYLLRGGDWRQNLGIKRTHKKPEDWVDDFASHQERIAEAVKRG